MNKNIKLLTYNAIIAAVYALLTLVLSPISYGSIQMRISEILVLLAFYNKKFIPGLTIGCFLANMASPLGMWDMCFGTLATFIAVVSVAYLPKKIYGALSASLVNGIIVGLELTLLFKELPFVFNALYVFIGEVIVLIIGVIIFDQLEKRIDLKKYLL